MTNKLYKPYTGQQYAEFAMQAQANGKIISVTAEYAEMIDPPAAEPVVEESTSITPRQLRLYLYQHYNITSAQLDGLVAGNEAAKIELEYASVIVRTNPLIADFAAELGLSEADIAAMFNEAKNL